MEDYEVGGVSLWELGQVFCLKGVSNCRDWITFTSFFSDKTDWSILWIALRVLSLLGLEFAEHTSIDIFSQACIH